MSAKRNLNFRSVARARFYSRVELSQKKDVIKQTKKETEKEGKMEDADRKADSAVTRRFFVANEISISRRRAEKF